MRVDRLVVFREVPTARGGGRWRWRMIARNGKKIATSGEAFASKSNAIRAASGMALLLAEKVDVYIA